MAGDVVTIAESLKSAGYATAAFGMWNLGRGRKGPSTATGQGFDEFKKPQDLGFEQHAYFNAKQEFLTDVLKLSWAEAHHEAGRWEHVMSESVTKAMDELLALNDALERLADQSPERAELVKLRFFAGLKYREIAETMGCSLLTAKNRVKRALQRIATWIREEPLSNDGDWP